MHVFRTCNEQKCDAISFMNITWSVRWLLKHVFKRNLHASRPLIKQCWLSNAANWSESLFLGFQCQLNEHPGNKAVNVFQETEEVYSKRKILGRKKCLHGVSICIILLDVFCNHLTFLTDLENERIRKSTWCQEKVLT